MIAVQILGVSQIVSDLEKAEAFYRDALGFESGGEIKDLDPAILGLMAASQGIALEMKRGRQAITLIELNPLGDPYPSMRHSNDPFFQHCALVTADIEKSYQKLCRYKFHPISRDGPQPLPGGIIAFKFRDEEHAPLELIQFPEIQPETAGGIDHTAIVVTDRERSLNFYQNLLGFTLAAEQTNEGKAQDALDNLDHTMVEVLGLRPRSGGMHLEFLLYRAPVATNATKLTRTSVGARYTLIEVDGFPDDARPVILMSGEKVALLIDPDGHFLLLMQRP